MFESKTVVVAVAIFIAYLTYSYSYNLYFHALAKIPGPRTWSASRLPFFKSLIKGTFIHDTRKLHAKYGKVIRIAPNEVVFAQAEAWNDIFENRPGHKQFSKDPIWYKELPGLSPTLINAFDSAEHSRLRRKLTPGFTTGALRAQEPIIQRYVNLLVERLKERVETESSAGKGVEIDISKWLAFTTFDIFGDLGFGESFDCLQDSKYHPWVSLLFESVQSSVFIIAARYYPVFEYLLVKFMPAVLEKMLHEHNQMIAGKIKRRLNWELQRPDIMEHVIQRRSDKTGIGMTNEQLNATFQVLTTAGSETTATTLAGAITFLVQRPESLEMLKSELRESFDDLQMMTLDTIKDLPYLNATLNEAMRLCPAVPWMLPRTVPKGGDTVAGIWLPGGTVVSVNPWTLNRDPAYFHSPDIFAPERWLDEAKSNPQSPYFQDRRNVIQPFSIGPRSCLGQNLAWAELRLILGKLIWSFDFEVIEGKTLKWESLRSWCLFEKTPVDVRMKLRAS